MNRAAALLAAAALAAAIGFAARAQNQTDPARQAQELVDRGRIDEALPLFRQALANNPDDANACSVYATVLCNSGQRGEGMAAADGCLRRRPRESSLHLARGTCNQSRGPEGFDDAAADYQRAIALAPGNAAAHNQLGVILQARGEHQKALAEFQAAMDADPTLLIAWNNKASSLISLGRHREAIALLQTAIQRSDNLKGMYFYTNLGNAFMQSGMPGRAEAAFLMETAINPNHLEAHLNLGNLYALRRRYSDAVYEYKYILISDPKNRDALINLGAVLVMAGDADEALGYLEQAVKLYPDAGVARHYLGQAWSALGEPEKAAAEEKRAIQLGYRASSPASGPAPAAP